MRRGVLLVLVALAAACGGGDGDGISKAEFIERADEICTEFNGQIRAVPRPPSILQYPAYADRVLPLARRQMEELRDLPEPEEGANEANEIFDELERTIDLGGQLADAVRREDSGAAQQAFDQSQEAVRRAAGLAQSFGFRSCGRPPT